MNRHLMWLRTASTFLVGIALAHLIWWLSPIITGKIEPMDSMYFYIISTFIAGVLAAWIYPRWWWAAGLGVYAGLFIAPFFFNPCPVLEWLAFGIFVDTFMLLWVPPLAGAFMSYAVFAIRQKRTEIPNSDIS